MAAVAVIKLISATFLLGLLILNLTVAQVGVCYGKDGNNLPSPRKTVALCKQNNIKRIRLYAPDESILRALGGSNIELMMGVPNTDIQNLASSQANANAWLQNNVRNYPSVRVRYIAVGNEVPRANASRFLLPALQNVYNAVSAAGLRYQIRVSTAIDVSGLGNSYPPSSGTFRSDVSSYLDPIIQFLVNTSAPLFVNIYPYFSYISNNAGISLQFALMEPQGLSLADGTKRYENLFTVMLDAMYTAVAKSGGSSVEIVVSESGWPSAGGGDSDSVDNARMYNTNLMRVVENGTPLRPNRSIEAYIYSMFDENMKAPEYEKHFGIFLPNGSPKYSISFGERSGNYSMRMSQSLICMYVDH